ncbi:LysR family transcriptional regulator [Xanthomonas vesicatoria]|uniref:LysR family transcriptional regulator n=2 Tax=Xanthomonas vesicatoria TaxID=56460 RepID=A0AAJ0IZG6_9XANT|nr:LysR family transcriptional regulator [Xanthomonas vesicatoria]APO94505.1 LysR family transcriptional regulator [Xanthomonas vesicatoria]APP74740.1 LysR family transcriptional regulator [Xanthomonas vesicatoria ATCC 35937]EGD07882.1 transcriptional regulator, LysR family [Xanthomonas vesicatoria ATCC 35937]KHM90627.1 LysR family transcriptional regulator [Xanthomonas vesicatoria]KHM95886.1 LysR family transcriptional regulator [Xanthomonas vesicatoria]
MTRENLNDLQVFVTVAREGSFTRAAAQLGVSQSALSHTVRALETRLGIRLLTRTTRSVSTTEAGARLFATVAPRLQEIDDELSALTDFRDKPAGTIRITTAGHAADAYVWPALSKLLPDYPDLKIEVTVDYGLADIVAERYDIGIRLGDQVAKDMIAVPISPPQRMAVVAVPGYFVHHTIPAAPADLAQHNCIGLRLPTHGGLLAWEFEQSGREIKVRVDGQWTFNSSGAMLRAALAGAGLAYLPESMVLDHIAAGQLRRVLEDWCEPFEGYYAYYPSRRQSSSALKVVIDALRHDLAR